MRLKSGDAVAVLCLCVCVCVCVPGLRQAAMYHTRVHMSGTCMYIKRERRYSYLSANRLRYARLRGWLHYDHCAGWPCGSVRGARSAAECWLVRDSAAWGSGIARAAYMPATRARFRLQYSELYLHLNRAPRHQYDSPQSAISC